jgi:hypothetical protein
MSRQNTDLNYIEVGYFTPEEYYVYTANADSAQSVTATFTCAIGKVQTASSSQTASLTQTVNVTRVIEFDCDFGALFSPSMTAEALKNHTAVLDAVVSMSVDAVVNRSAAITLANIINQSSQAVKTVDIQSTQTTAFTQSTNGIIQKSASANLNATSTWSDNAGKLQTVAAAFTTTATVTTTKSFGSSRPRPYTSVGSPQINTSIKKFGAGSARLDGSNYVTVPASPDWSQAQTVDLWFYIDSADIPSGGQHNLLVWGTSLSNVTRIYLESQPAPGAGISSINIDSNTSLFWSRAYNTNRPALNTWHHLRVLDNGSSLTLWLNGSRQTPDSTTYNSAGLAGNRELQLGTLNNLGQRFYLDELLITKQQLTSSSTTSFSVPTDRWKPTDQTPIYLLSHYDTDFSDDIGIWQFGESSQSATFTTTATADGITKSSSASLAAQFTQVIDAQSIKLVESSLTSTASQTTEASRFRDVNSSNLVTATESVVIGTIKQFNVSVSGALQSTVDADATLRPLVYLESQAVISVTAEKITDVVSAQTVVSTQTASILYTANAQSSQAVTVSQTANNIRVRYALADFAATVAVTATGSKIPPFSSSMSVTADISAEATKFKRTEAALSAVFTAPDIKFHVKHNIVASLEQAFFAQTTDGIRIRFFDSTQTASAQTSILAVKTTDVNSIQSMTATETATVVKTVDADIDNLVAFGSSIDADLTARPLVYLESQFAMTTVIGSIKQFQTEEPIQGIEFQPDTFIQLYRQNDTTSLPRTTANFLVAFWAYSPDGTVLDHFSHSVYDQGNIKIYPDRVEFRDVATAHNFDTDQWQPTYGNNTGYQIQWTGLDTANWNHYILYRNGSQQKIKLFINGIDQGDPSVGQPYAGYLGLESPVADGTGNRRLQWTIGADAEWWHESINELTKAARSITPMQGGLTQLVTYFDSSVPNALDSAVRERFYLNGYRDLGEQGTDTGLSTPRIYLDLDTYDDYQNRGNYQLAYLEPRQITDQDYDPIWDNVNWTLTTGYTPSITDLVNPGFIVVTRLTAGFIGVFLFVANFSAQTTQSASALRLRGTAINFNSTATMTTAVTVTAGAVINHSATVTMNITVSKFTGYTSTQAVQFTQAAIIGLFEQGQATLSDQFSFVCDFNALAPTRAEADLSVTASLVCDAASFTDMISLQVSAASLTADVTVIPPIRTSADLTATATMSVIIGSREQFAVLTQSMGTMTVQSVITARPQCQLTSRATIAPNVTKRTGIVANLTVRGFQLTQGDVINIDPFLTLIIEPESRLLTVNEESKVLNIEQETRNLIVEGWE